MDLPERFVDSEIYPRRSWTLKYRKYTKLKVCGLSYYPPARELALQTLKFHKNYTFL